MNSIFRPAAWHMSVCLIFMLPLAEAGQIFKCTGNDGSVEFSNLVCPSNTVATMFTVKSNFVELSDTRDQLRMERQQRQDGTANAVANDSYMSMLDATLDVCDSDIEIRNPTMRASSDRLGREERRILAAEVQRARRCRAGQGSLDDANWQPSQQVQAYQGRFANPPVGPLHVEAVRSAADPIQGERRPDERWRAIR